MAWSKGVLGSSAPAGRAAASTSSASPGARNIEASLVRGTAPPTDPIGCRSGARKRSPDQVGCVMAFAGELGSCQGETPVGRAGPAGRAARPRCAALATPAGESGGHARAPGGGGGAGILAAGPAGAEPATARPARGDGTT